MTFMGTVEAGASANAIGLPKSQRTCVDCGAPVTRKAKRCKQHSYEHLTRPMPDDFAEMAKTLSTEQLTRHYRAGAEKVLGWLASIGIKRSISDTQFRRRQIPNGFAALASTISTDDLSERFGVGRELVRRWRRELGIVGPRRQNFIIRHPGTNMHDPHRDPSLAGRAVDECLRRISGMHRCDADGTPNPKGIYWDRGGHVLTDEEVIGRARARGWNPDKWKELAK